MREYWAREAEMMRDKSGILGNKEALSPVDFSADSPDQIITTQQQLGDISADKKNVFLTNEEKGKGLKQMWVPIPSNEKIQETSKNVIKGIEYARKQGMPMAADNLERWFNGKAEKVYDFPNSVKNSNYVKQGLEKIFFYFLRNKNSSVNVTLLEYANNLKPGETRAWTDTWEAIVELGNELLDRSDMFFAFGSVNLKSYGQFKVTKNNDNTIDITGTVTHTLSDKYNWNPCGSTLLSPTLRVYDNDLLCLQLYKNPKAKVYEFKYQWSENFVYKTYPFGSTLRMLGGREY